MSGASDAKKITKYVNEIMRLMDRVTELKLVHENYKSMVRDRDKRIAELEAALLDAFDAMQAGDMVKDSTWSLFMRLHQARGDA